MTEAQAKEAGHEIKTSKFKLGRIGNRACDMISELVNTMALEGGYQELARIIHLHPPISESVPEAARAIEGWATHA